MKIFNVKKILFSAKNVLKKDFLYGHLHQIAAKKVFLNHFLNS